MFDLPHLKQDNKNNPAPLLCWDVYSESLHKLYQQLEDKLFLENFFCNKTIDLKGDLLEILRDNDALVLADVNHEIFWVSSGFQSMTGYPLKEAVGSKISFLKGKKTDTNTLEYLHHNLVHFNSVTVDIVNYRKNKTEYLCHIHIEPIFDQKLNPVGFLAFQKILIDKRLSLKLGAS